MQSKLGMMVLVGVLACGGALASQDHLHNGAPKKSAGPAGYESSKSVTRYELATALFQLLTHIDAAAKQPARSARERRPGRQRVLVPDRKKVRSYADVPKDHWAKASLAGLQARGLSLVAGAKFQGDNPVTGDELAVWVDGLAAWTEGRAPSAKKLGDLVRGGYLPQTSPLLKKAASPVTAAEVSELLTLVITRAHEKVTTISPDSKHSDG